MNAERRRRSRIAAKRQKERRKHNKCGCDRPGHGFCPYCSSNRTNAVRRAEIAAEGRAE
jgi:hypothetical protein